MGERKMLWRKQDSSQNRRKAAKKQPISGDKAVRKWRYCMQGNDRREGYQGVGKERDEMPPEVRGDESRAVEDGSQLQGGRGAAQWSILNIHPQTLLLVQSLMAHGNCYCL
ncbi:hypothetical protein SRHO_G00215250 [Serrasalmus rhombeus]